MPGELGLSPDTHTQYDFRPLLSARGGLSFLTARLPHSFSLQAPFDHHLIQLFRVQVPVTRNELKGGNLTVPPRYAAALRYHRQQDTRPNLASVGFPTDSGRLSKSREAWPLTGNISRLEDHAQLIDLSFSSM